MGIDLIIMLICSIAITLLGLLILVRNPRQGTNRRFAFLSISIALWTVANYLSDNATHHVLLYTRLTFFGGIATAFTLINFVANFPSDSLFHKSKVLRIETVLAYILMVASLTPVFISSVVIDSSGAGTINTGAAYNLFLVFIVYTLAVLGFVIWKQFKNANNHIQKQQIGFISLGIGLYAVLAVISNVLLPIIVNDWSSSRFGPAFSLILTVMVAYTIAKHQLFDIRLIVARSIAYILSLGTMAIIFTTVTIIISNIIFGNNLSTTDTRTIYALLAIALAFSFPPLKKFFDKITNKYFYRDAYDLKSAIDGFSGVLVASIDLDLILNETRNLFNSTVRPQFTHFTLISKHVDANIKQDELSFSEKDQKVIKDYVKKHKQPVIIPDNLESDDNNIKELLNSKNVRVIVQLETSDDNVGMIVLGPKLTGSIYNSQDITFLTIVGKELALAVQNALRFREIQQFNVTLQEKVDDATHKLRKANDRLRALDETKDEFISMASHQLRTPLTTVKGYVSMVLDGDAGKVSEEQRKLLDQSFLSAQRMVYLIADLLNVSRLRTGKFVIDSTPTNLAELVEGEIEQLKETAKGRHLELTYTKPKDFPDLMLDETKIRQVVMNFADNAIYYTPAGGHIKINLEDKGDNIEFTVVDDGIGVPKTVQHHLFSKFYRADNAKKARPDGTGLGLFMAQKVVVAQGGVIIFRSEEGKGSTFGFSFNKAKLKVPANYKPGAHSGITTSPLSSVEPAAEPAKEAAKSTS